MPIVDRDTAKYDRQNS